MSGIPSILAILLVICFAFHGRSQSAHSHNDYGRPRPFQHAFARGFRSIEADVWLVDGRLLVAHDRKDTRSERSLATLYLDPLAGELDRQGRWKRGPEDRRLQLLIDVKSEPVSALEALQRLLLRYPKLISSSNIDFTVSGNRPPVETYRDWHPRIRFDGRPGTSYDSSALARVALISDSWTHYIDRITFRFDTLRAARAVDSAHALGKPFRFWASPDDEAGWRFAIRLGADLLNTDRIDALADFLADQAGLFRQDVLPGLEADTPRSSDKRQ